jgi:uncharacterized repeat protein (TIGR01451 family)
MGRRYLLILGILLLVPSVPALVRAQDGAGPPAPDPSPASPSDVPPPARPVELPSTEGGLPPVGEPKSEDPKPPRSVNGDAPSATPQDENPPARPLPATLPSIPSLSPAAPAEPAPSASEPSKSPHRAKPLQDPAVTQADSGSPSAGEPDGLPAEQVPAGKQAVAVTVDVQSPPTMNLHQRATVRLVIRNTGASPALAVRIRDELPEGLKYISSSSEPNGKAEGTSVLSWSLGTMPGGSEKVIAVDVEPVKTGPLDHSATVWFQTGSRAQTRVFQPQLKIEQIASAAKVLKGHAVEFKILVKNVGDGPARDVKIAAKLSSGLRYGSGGRGESEVVTDPIPVLAPKQSYELDPLVAEALKDGQQTCTVTAVSPDVITQDKSEDAHNTATITVIEPKLTVAVLGPPRRCTDTEAQYEVAVGNPGTATARKVRVGVIVPAGARLLEVPEGARYDQANRRLQWSIDNLEPSQTPTKLPFKVKVGDVGKYEVAADAIGTGVPKARQSLVTEVFGMPDIDLVVSEQQRVIDVGGKTTFQIHLRNYGTKEATNVFLNATLTKNIKLLNYSTSEGVPAELQAWQNGEQIVFGQNKTEAAAIPRLGPGKTETIGLEVEVTGDKPNVATCRVQVKYDEMPEGFDDMARVKILPPASRPTESGGK